MAVQIEGDCVMAVVFGNLVVPCGVVPETEVVDDKDKIGWVIGGSDFVVALVVDDWKETEGIRLDNDCMQEMVEVQ